MQQKPKNCLKPNTSQIHSSKKGKENDVIGNGSKMSYGILKNKFPLINVLSNNSGPTLSWNN